MLDSTRRFSSRVENYVKYRPGYPKAILALLRRDCGLTPGSAIADIGSGTGLSARLFLANGNRVCGVEPNQEMREAAERLLAKYARFTSVSATAEATTLPEASADFVVAGQAFHWFDIPTTRTEFTRISKPDGWIVLMWNERHVSDTLFLRNYERILKTYCPEYPQVDHRRVDARVLHKFFGRQGFRFAHFDNAQQFDFEGVRGRLLSSSYAPEPGQPAYEPLLADLSRVFDACQSDGHVAFRYDTQVYYGHLS